MTLNFSRSHDANDGAFESLKVAQRNACESSYKTSESVNREALRQVASDACKIMGRVRGADSGRDGTVKSQVPSEICMDILYTCTHGLSSIRREPASRRCKFYRPDKSGLVDGGHKDALLCIYIPT